MTINDIGIQFGKYLVGQGINVLSKSVVLSPTEITSIDAKSIIENYFPSSKTVFLDGKYRIISWDKWQELDRTIWDITKKMWESEVWDCDDKAYTHKYWTLRIFGIPQFVVHGHCYDLKGNWLFGHFWNAKISDGELYFYEPDGNKWVKVEKGQKVIMKEREYRPIIFEF